MNELNAFINLRLQVSAASLILAIGAVSQASVLSTRATVSTTVQELVSGEAGSVTSDSDALGDDPSVLPISATGNLLTTDLNGVLLATGQGLSVFSQPNLVGQNNPEEFALEVGCYSNSDTVSYEVDGQADETRTLLFATEGNPLAAPDLGFGFGSTRLVQSRIFLSGAVIFWSDDPTQSLADMVAELTVNVIRLDTGATLFSTGLTVSGLSAGSAIPTTAGPLQFDLISLSELASDGVDAASIAILEAVRDDGTLIIVAIPDQQHAYTYTVTADEVFDIQASFQVRVQNVPGGTGVTATWGRPFAELTDFVDQGLPGVDGLALQKAVNRAVERRAIQNVISSQTVTTPGGLCGALGVEMLPIVALGLFLTLGRTRRRLA